MGLTVHGASRRTVHVVASIARRTAVVTTAVGSAVGSGSRAVGIALTRSAKSGGGIASRLVGDFTTIGSSAIGIGGARNARTILVAIFAGGAIAVNSARSFADTRGYVTERLVGGFSTIGISTIGIGNTSCANAIFVAVVALSISTVGVYLTRIATETRD